MIVRTLPEFDAWLLGLNAHERADIDNRLDRIREHNHFGDKKYLGGRLFELRWRNGRRAYYSLAKDAQEQVVLMLLGGAKNGQERDIVRARKILGWEDA